MRKIDLVCSEFNRKKRAKPDTINRIMQDLQELIGYDIYSDEMILLIEDWNRSVTRYHEAPAKLIELRDQANRADKVVADLTKGLRGLRTVKVHKEQESFGNDNRNSYVIDQAIQWMMSYINQYKFKQSEIIGPNKNSHRQDYIISLAVSKLFNFGVELGLKPVAKVIGRGNKNKLLEFAKIISGIDDRKRLRRYYSSYFKNKYPGRLLKVRKPFLTVYHRHTESLSNPRTRDAKIFKPEILIEGKQVDKRTQFLQSVVFLHEKCPKCDGN